MNIEKLGPYKIGRQLGRGGMGVVYAGLNPETGEEAAIKVLGAAFVTEEGFRERFEGEIETLKKLRHPNIVRLFGYGEQDGLLFYSMELVNGTNLEELLKQGRKFAWPEVFEIALKMCSALKHAHDRGVIHRDIKPANLLQAQDGEIKLSDFGIAKLFGATGMTSTGGVLGTAEYMAPEQADGRAVSHRCDLYSLGCVMYALLAGRPPFVARSIPEVLHMVRFAQPEPLRRYCTDVPDEVCQIVQQLLDKNPERRMANATVLARRLEATRYGLQIRARTPGHTEADDQFEYAGPSDVTVERKEPPASSDLLAPTRLDSRMPQQRVTGTGSGPQVDPFGQTQVTGEPQVEEEAEPAKSDSGVRTATHFTTVDETETDYSDLYGGDPPGLISTKTWALIAALVVIGLAVWYQYQPPSADNLYTQIVSKVEAPDSLGAVAAEDEIYEFLRYYPSDKRGRQMEGYLADIELYRLERRFELRAKRMVKSDGLLPIEAMYLDAISRAPYDPPDALAKLKALVALFSTGGERVSNDKTELCLRLARQQIDRIEPPARTYMKEHLDIINQQLDQAEKLDATQPNEARKLREAVINLYGDKPWAALSVQRAENALPAKGVANVESANESVSNADSPQPSQD